MVRIFCEGQHGTGDGLCSECCELLHYAVERLKRCPFEERKPTCADCPIHCYRPAMRDKIRAVMRYSGPRMLFRHPVLAIHHLVDALRKRPIRPGDRGPNSEETWG
ncbi:MAG: nitrous oxide-stimulated promoter family protein [Anaerolineae bacterium]|nr:nitrous oxide-stimulated promoter family protein [Anaerolineae bacterium]